MLIQSSIPTFKLETGWRSYARKSVTLIIKTLDWIRNELVSINNKLSLSEFKVLSYNFPVQRVIEDNSIQDIRDISDQEEYIGQKTPVQTPKKPMGRSSTSSPNKISS